MVNKLLIFGEFNKINGMYHVLENFQAFTYFRFWAITPFINNELQEEDEEVEANQVSSLLAGYQLRYY
jgi:hypothetical protein